MNIGTKDFQAKVGVITYGRVAVSNLNLLQSARLEQAGTVRAIKGKFWGKVDISPLTLITDEWKKWSVESYSTRLRTKMES